MLARFLLPAGSLLAFRGDRAYLSGTRSSGERKGKHVPVTVKQLTELFKEQF